MAPTDERAATDAASYFATRLTRDAKREVLWRTLCEEVFQAYVPPGGTVIELGAGWCEFINNIAASRRVAVDLWEGIVDAAEPGVETHVGSATDLGFLEDDSVDLVFASNLVEHLVMDDAHALVNEARRVLAPGGRLALVQPNYRLCAKRYFDDYTHVSVWSDVGMSDFLQAEGYDIERLEARFMPFSVKSHLPVSPTLIKAYLRSPIRPAAGQMLVVARPR